MRAMRGWGRESKSFSTDHSLLHVLKADRGLIAPFGHDREIVEILHESLVPPA